MQKSNIETLAEQYAIKAHASVNHLYDGQPYEVHLRMVAELVFDNWGLFHSAELRLAASAAAWLHDTIEDCRLTYNDIKSVFGTKVAELVYALTNEKGRTRKDRANEEYYRGIQNCQGACIVKIADRIANVEYSKAKGSSMFDKYKQEHEHFVMQIWGNHDHPMIQHLDKLFKD